eukprot:CAMPEP_0172527028 /NCGR_PEP_ID=MMETSP1067-20121228/1817_1 /TAXON_ID=265564 ORGANISM="Thalassiosira punctigera, Strain Tpunct2005C2" /NCGR_SAMPLE_ID=MMETSP1067 /ASSEMBLY_ACC=CAM_ASM_000444 /LENGTH=275 /DNA_ID=CAMNT_0013310685 /DNA_START=53 /DNA_END=880 /DNA_ORIENTATION=-
MRGLLSFVITLAALPAASLAFAPGTSGRRRTVLPAVATGPNGRPAGSKEEDLDLTREVIMSAIASADGDTDPSSATAVAEAAESSAEETPQKAEKKKKKKKKAPPPAEEFVADISKLDIRVGTILEAWEHEEADKLFCERIDVGEDEPRTIATGVRAHYKAEDLVGRRVCVLANLKTRKLVGFPSHGMVLCASTEDGSEVVFVDPPADAAVGERCLCDGFEGEAATENQVGKKKILDKVFPDFMTNEEGVVTYKGVPLTAGLGKCVAGLINAQVA